MGENGSGSDRLPSGTVREKRGVVIAEATGFAAEGRVLDGIARTDAGEPLAEGQDVFAVAIPVALIGPEEHHRQTVRPTTIATRTIKTHPAGSPQLFETRFEVVFTFAKELGDIGELWPLPQPRHKQFGNGTKNLLIRSA
jgi:hypothetical protein